MLDYTLVHNRYAIRYCHGLLLVMGHIDSGDPDRLLNMLNHRAHFHTQFCV